MKNKLILLVAFALASVSASYAEIEQNFNVSATGTTSATAIVPSGTGIAEVTDLSYRLDAGTTTGTISQYAGARAYLITSATASAASVLWISNDSTGIAVGEFIIFLDASTGNYFLRRVSAATTTSITINSSIAVTTEVTNDRVWSTLATVEKPVENLTTGANSRSGGLCSIWLPAGVPSALVIDGNTTSCRISVNGVRGNRK